MKYRFGLLLCLMAAGVGSSEFDYRLSARHVAPDVHVLIGPTEDFSLKNGGNIVNTGFIVASEGVIVIDSGPSKRYGEQMRAVIARVSPKPVAKVINTHHHPDHFLGNQAFADRPIAALSATRQGIVTEGNAFAENLYRMAGNWMKGTEVVAPTETLGDGPLQVAGRMLRLIALNGHTVGDLAIYDEASGVLFAGDLVFNGRAPTTPHADISHWLLALDKLEAITREPGFKLLVPGHGEVAGDAAPIRQTRDWLNWLRQTLREAAVAGLDMNEVLARPLPPQFANLPVAETEYRRSVGHLFPAAELEALK